MTESFLVICRVEFQSFVVALKKYLFAYIVVVPSIISSLIVVLLYFRVSVRRLWLAVISYEHNTASVALMLTGLQTQMRGLRLAALLQS